MYSCYTNFHRLTATLFSLMCCPPEPVTGTPSGSTLSGDRTEMTATYTNSCGTGVPVIRTVTVGRNCP